MLGRLLVLLLKIHDHPGVGRYVTLHLLALLLHNLDGVVVLSQLVIGLIEVHLQLLQFLTVVSDVT